MALLFSQAKPFVQYWKKASWGTILWNYFEFWTVVQEKMLFKGISYLELWQPFCSAERNYLCNFGRGYLEVQFHEIILNLGQWFRRRCRIKYFLSGALATLLFSGAEPFIEFWKRASWGPFMWSYMKLGPVVQEEMLFKQKVYGPTDGRTTDKDLSQYLTLSLRFRWAQKKRWTVCIGEASVLLAA